MERNFVAREQSPYKLCATENGIQRLCKNANNALAFLDEHKLDVAGGNILLCRNQALRTDTSTIGKVVQSLAAELRSSLSAAPPPLFDGIFPGIAAAPALFVTPNAVHQPYSPIAALTLHLGATLKASTWPKPVDQFDTSQAVKV